MNRYEIYADMLNIPFEIFDFSLNIFMLIEVRGKVGNIGRLVFMIHTNEGKHLRPHVHAEYGDHNISIDIVNSEIIKGNLPRRQMRLAQDWVTVHRESLLDKWRYLAIDREIPMMISALNTTKSNL